MIGKTKSKTQTSNGLLPLNQTIFCQNNDESCYIRIWSHSLEGACKGSGLTRANKKHTKKTDFSKNFEQHYILPGYGRKSLTCVGIIPHKFCSNPKCSKISLVEGNCKSPSCPDCFKDWIYKRTDKTFEKIFSYKIEKKSRIGHFLISPPEEVFNINPEKLRKKSRVLLKKKGVKGALEIFHPFRMYPDKKQELFKIVKKKYPKLGEYGLWKILQQLKVKGKLDNLKLNWKHFVYYSPHFHYIGVFDYTKKADKKDEFVFKKIGRDLTRFEHFSKKGLDIIRLSMYLFSHTGIHILGKQNTRWIGVLSNSSWCFNKASQKVKDYVISQKLKLFGDFKKQDGYGVCSDCGNIMYDITELLHFLNNYPEADKKRLRFAYSWYCGTIPPPIEKTIIDWVKGKKD